MDAAWCLCQAHGETADAHSWSDSSGLQSMLPLPAGVSTQARQLAFAPFSSVSLLHPGLIVVTLFAQGSSPTLLVPGPISLQVEGDLEVSAVLSGPGQGATVLTGKQQQQQQTAHHQQPHHQQGQQQPPLQRHLSWQPLAKDRLGSSVAAAASAGGAGASVVHAAATAAGSGGSWQPDLAAAEPQLSARKRVSAVVDVSPAEFQRFMLAAMRK